MTGAFNVEFSYEQFGPSSVLPNITIATATEALGWRRRRGSGRPADCESLAAGLPVPRSDRTRSFDRRTTFEQY